MEPLNPPSGRPIIWSDAAYWGDPIFPPLRQPGLPGRAEVEQRAGAAGTWVAKGEGVAAVTAVVAVVANPRQAIR
jgi:hypothetical protein